MICGWILVFRCDRALPANTPQSPTVSPLRHSASPPAAVNARAPPLSSVLASPPPSHWALSAPACQDAAGSWRCLGARRCTEQGPSVPTGSAFPLPPVQLSTPTRAHRTFRSFAFCPEQHSSATYKPHRSPAWSQRRKNLYVTGPVLRGRRLDSACLFFSCHRILGPFLYFPMYSQWVHVTLCLGKNQHYFFLISPKLSMIWVICPGLISDGGWEGGSWTPPKASPDSAHRPLCDFSSQQAFSQDTGSFAKSSFS